MKIYRKGAVILHDLGMIAAAWTVAHLISHNLEPGVIRWGTLAAALPVIVGVQGLVLRWMGLYLGLWRFASTPDLWNIVRGAALGTLAVSLALFLYNRLEDVSRILLLLYPVFLVFFLATPRLIYRTWQDNLSALRLAPHHKRVLILGAGRTGERLAHDMLGSDEYRPIGFLDDQPGLRGIRVHGVPVMGILDELPAIAPEHQPDLLVIAMPSASSAQMKRVVGLCERTNIPFRTLPRLQDVMFGRPMVRELREVAIEDLLGREPVALDWRAISEGLAGKAVLVSGGGGSIGAELCRQIVRLGPAALVILDHSEHNLYKIDLELRRDFPNVPIHSHLGDVSDRATVEHVLATNRPDVIFHAAAYKHVPMLQNQVREAVRNNVLGTRVLALAAARFGCEGFVLVSTDKAVNPTNTMGASKRVAELYCQGLNRRSTTRFITVRFGNVLGSAGSVVPLFEEQIRHGGPVTVTHPEITRYFMTLTEACHLIMQAAVMGRGGEIFVLDMGEPVSITYLAEQMILLSGKVPGQDVKIVYTGLRPGEKLFEELFYPQENLAHTAHDKILLAHHHTLEWDWLEGAIDQIEQACQRYDEAQIKALLKRLVPELYEAGREKATVVPLSAARRSSQAVQLFDRKPPER